MNREEAYNFVEDHLQKAFDDVKALYEQEQSREAEIRKKVNDACGAYFADLRAKKERIIQQIAALNSRTAEIGTEKEQQHQALMNAAAAGDSEAVANTQRCLIELEAEQLSIPGQIEALKNLAIPGDKTLYDAAQEAFAKYQDDMGEGVTDGIWETVHDIFYAMAFTFHMGEYAYGVTAYGSTNPVANEKEQIRKSMEKMENNYSGSEPFTLAEDARRRGIQI